MGYMHIDNLYRPEAQTILLFKECYALEKIHGTSAHIRFEDDRLCFYAGGEKHENFVKLFDHEALLCDMQSLGHAKVTVFGEAYGGKQQGQSWRYGKELKFVAFDVKIEDSWLVVPSAMTVVDKLGLEFVHVAKVPTDLKSLDAERDAPSVQAKRNGIVEDCRREGVVLRPPIELTMNDGKRIIAKHKRPEERETKSIRNVGDPTVALAAKAFADEWVTPMRLQHVLDKLGECGTEDFSRVIDAMIEDVTRESAGEIPEGPSVRKYIASSTAILFKKHLHSMIADAPRR